MCHDGNSAGLSIRYLNSQLSALWENAVECAKSVQNSSWDVRSEKYEQSKYTRALAQFHFYGKRAPKIVGSPSPTDFHFYATFGKPDIRFICNHDALLTFTIESGHANLDTAKVLTGNGGVRADAYVCTWWKLLIRLRFICLQNQEPRTQKCEDLLQTGVLQEKHQGQQLQDRQLRLVASHPDADLGLQQ